MPIVGNRHYNDPGIGAAFSNIAQMFAPPSAQDTFAYAKAKATSEEAARLADFYASAGPDFDRRGVAAGLYTPSQSYYAVDQSNVTAQRGQDIQSGDNRYSADQVFGASTQNNIRDNSRALETNAADNARAMAEREVIEAASLQRQNASPVILNPGQRAFLPNQTAAATGLAGQLDGSVAPMSSDEVIAAAMQQMPGTTVQGFAVDKFAPSATQVEGQNMRMLQDSGQITPEMMVDTIMGGGGGPVQAVGPEGPVFMSPGAAIRTGAQPVINKGAEARPTNALAKLPDGTTVPAIQGSDGRWKYAQTGADLPENVQIFDTPKPTGTAEEVGLSRTTNTRVEQSIIDTTIARNTAVTLREMIASSPASQGAVGWMRGTAQNILQTGGELGQFFGGATAEVMRDIQSGAADANLAGAFDPNIPAIDIMANLLAFQYAKTTTGERLSNEMLNASRQALGLDRITANQADALARLDQAIVQIDSQQQILQSFRTNGVGGAGAPTPPAPPAAPSAPRDPAAGSERWERGPDGKLTRAR